MSVVIPSYNAAPFIADTLASVCRQDYGRLEVIVVDDGSEDNTLGVTARAMPDAIVLRTKRLGPGGARELGTEHARGEFIQYLDADDLLAPRKLTVQVEALREAGADVAYGAWQRLRETAAGYEPSGIVDRLLNEPEIELFTDWWSPLAAYLFSRDIVGRVGGWSRTLPIVQDARFVLDCAMRGARFIRCDGLMAFYRVRSGGSVSTRDPLAFLHDIYTNAREVHALWEMSGVTPSRRQALLWVYGYIARSAYRRDRELFDRTEAILQELMPHYRPASPSHLRLAAGLVGYRRAEWIAALYRRLRYGGAGR